MKKPNLKMPSLPKVNIPEIKLPKVNIPKTKLPTINIPFQNTIIKKLTFKLATKAYIGIYFDEDKCYLRADYSNTKIKPQTRVFEKTDEGNFSGAMIKFINDIQKKYSFTYIATLISSINTGAILGCLESDYQRMHINTSFIAKTCIEEKWSAYGSLYAIDEKKELFEDVGGIDFIFPAELIIYHILKQDPSNMQKLYILTTKSHLVLTIFHETTLYFSANFIYSEDEEENDLEEDVKLEDVEDMSNLIEETQKESKEVEEVLDLEKMDEVADLDDGSLEDLDELEDIETEEFDEIDALDDVEDGEDIDYDEEEDHKEVEEPEVFSKKEQLMCEFIKNLIEDFYKNPLYKSEFISKAKVFDATIDTKIAKHLTEYISDELFLECELKEIDLCEIINQISTLESQAV